MKTTKKHTHLTALLAVCLAAAAAAGLCSTAIAAKNEKVVRACVIGGMTLTGTWQEIAAMFEKQTGYRVEVVVTGPRTKISPVFRAGNADILTMHSGDITTNLVVDGYGINMRPWAQNDLVILGPADDPAKIRGLTSAVEAYRRIAETQSPFLDVMGAGKREMNHNIWKKAHIRPIGEWVLKDEAVHRFKALTYASKNGAYTIYGRMPVLMPKIPTGKLEVLVEGDPMLRRPYIVMEANPAIFQDVNHKGARALSDFLLSKKVQTFLKTYGADTYGGIPCFHPVWPYLDEKQTGKTSKKEAS